MAVQEEAKELMSQLDCTP